jgi:hypothetical protein
LAQLARFNNSWWQANRCSRSLWNDSWRAAKGEILKIGACALDIVRSTSRLADTYPWSWACWCWVLYNALPKSRLPQQPLSWMLCVIVDSWNLCLPNTTSNKRPVNFKCWFWSVWVYRRRAAGN